MYEVEKFAYICRAMCMKFCLVGSLGLQFIQPSIMSLYFPHYQHNNIHCHFLSVCRLQQLAMPSRLTVVLVSLQLATAVVIYWLWLVIVPARVAIRCPGECQCDTAVCFITCSRQSLNAFPLILLTNVRVLWLSDNNIKLLEKDSFGSMTELDILDISNCGLRTIKLGAFNGLTKLTHIDMRSNKISEITPGTFENMSSWNILNYMIIE